MEAPVTHAAVNEQLERVLSSPTFQGAVRSRALLTFLVQETLSDRADRLKEYTLGVEALEKGESFDPRTDPIVRAEASRLRGRLDRYYSSEGADDPVAITLPKGTYVPQFGVRPPPVVGGLGPARMRWLKWVAAAAVVLAFLTTAASWSTNRTAAESDRRLLRLEVELKSDGVLGSEVGTDVVVSPDGSAVAFVSREGNGQSRLNLRRLDQPLAAAIVGTEGARGPFFSPDGRWIGFWADRALKKVAIAGGLPTVICDAPDLLGASWGDEGTIVAAFGRNQLSRVSAAGGRPSVIADLASESIMPRWPQILLGGKLILFTAIGPAGPNMATIDVLSPADGKIRVVVRGGTYGRYLANGYLTYVNQGTLFGAPLDLDRMQLRGSAAPILDDVSFSSTFGYAQVDVSREGTLVYRRSAGGGESILQSIDASGKTDVLLSRPAHYGWPRLSPDGERTALSVTESGVGSVLIHDRRLNQSLRVAPGGKYGFPLWTRDGRALVLGGTSGLATVEPGGQKAPAVLVDTHAAAVPWSFSPDGRRLAYHAMGASSGFDLWTVPIQYGPQGLTAGTPEPFLQSSSFEVYPSFSPDGRWLSYGSNESGTWEVYVRRFPDDGTKAVVAASGGHISIWLPNGRELLYEDEDHRLMVVRYDDSGAFVAGAARPWPNGTLADTGVLSNFDVSPDGRSVVALVPGNPSAGDQTPNHVTLIVNLFDELRRRSLPGR